MDACLNQIKSKMETVLSHKGAVLYCTLWVMLSSNQEDKEEAAVMVLLSPPSNEPDLKIDKSSTCCMRVFRYHGNSHRRQELQLLVLNPLGGLSEGARSW